MSTKRQIIESFREKLKERNADSDYTNQFLYNSLMEHAKWLIKREISAGRIYRNSSLFQTLQCLEVIETSPTDPCCPIQLNCRVYRTKNKLPEMWIDNTGPVIKNVLSVDNTTDFFLTSANQWRSKKDDPYEKMAKSFYSFFSEGYIFFPEKNPHRVNIHAFFTDDISPKNECSDNKECFNFLNSKFMLPDWLEAEMFAKALQQLVPLKQLPIDEQIDKNTNRKN